MSTTSRIPAAVDALVTRLSTAIGTTTNVVDGPPLSWDTVALAQAEVDEARFLFIGATPDSDTSATGTQDFNAAGAVSRDEQIDIDCTVFVWAGDQVMKTRRDDAFGIVGQVEQSIRSDPSLGGAVLYSRLSAVAALNQRQTENGTDATVTFTVACRAYLD